MFNKNINRLILGLCMLLSWNLAMNQPLEGGSSSSSTLGNEPDLSHVLSVEDPIHLMSGEEVLCGSIIERLHYRNPNIRIQGIYLYDQAEPIYRGSRETLVLGSEIGPTGERLELSLIFQPGPQNTQTITLVRAQVPFSKGSADHPRCKPCNKFNPENPQNSCRHGIDCDFCHESSSPHQPRHRGGQRGRHAL